MKKNQIGVRGRSPPAMELARAHRLGEQHARAGRGGETRSAIAAAAVDDDDLRRPRRKSRFDRAGDPVLLVERGNEQTRTFAEGSLSVCSVPSVWSLTRENRENRDTN